jgi:chromosome segregation ATPase
MSIGLLWLLPILAFAVFIFIIAYFAQKSSREHQDPLAREVHQFNSGRLPRQHPLSANDIAQRRLEEIEGKISTLTGSLSDQQAILEKFQREAVARTSEISDLKKRLSDLHREYDMVLSENYSLRARIKLISKKLEMHKQLAAGTVPAPTEDLPAAESVNRQTAGTAAHLYDDTRVMNALQIDDTDQIDVASLH